MTRDSSIGDKMYRTRSSGWAEILIPLGLLAIFMIAQQVVAHWVPESRAVKAAEDVGYTDIVVKDRATFMVGLRGCDMNDSARFTVQGTNASGETRTFYVCAGYFKGGTVRSK